MNAQTRTILLTMAVSFGSTLAFLWWQRPLAASAPQVSVAQVTAMPRTSVAPVPPPHTRGSEIPSSVAPLPRAAVAPEPLQPNYDGPPLPVLFAVTTEAVARGESNTDEDPGGTPTSVKVANISSSSDQPLDLTLIAVDIPTQKTSQVSVFLTPGGRQTLGPDSGLRMDSGDQITLRSRGFHDLTETVP